MLLGEGVLYAVGSSGMLVEIRGGCLWVVAFNNRHAYLMLSQNVTSISTLLLWFQAPRSSLLSFMTLRALLPPYS